MWINTDRGRAPADNIQLLWITKIHSICNKGPYNFHSMTFYGFSKFFPVREATKAPISFGLVSMTSQWGVVGGGGFSLLP